MGRMVDLEMMVKKSSAVDLILIFQPKATSGSL
jgi:hypothetical protein